MMPKSKVCTKCDVDKPLDEFHRNKGGKFGRRAQCRVCMAEYREANRERISELQRQYHMENRERLAEYLRKYREANRDRLAEQHRRYYEANREQILRECHQYRMENRERLAESKREYREANRDRLAEKQRRYAEANPEKVAEHGAKRRAAKLNRTPAWADLETIKLYYEARQAISEATGRDYHVDHMIPLQGKTVSGLHVPGNLQIIPAERNIAKKNTF